MPILHVPFPKGHVITQAEWAAAHTLPSQTELAAILNNRYVRVIGDTMTGPLVINAPPDAYGLTLGDVTHEGPDFAMYSDNLGHIGFRIDPDVAEMYLNEPGLDEEEGSFVRYYAHPTVGGFEAHGPGGIGDVTGYVTATYASLSALSPDGLAGITFLVKNGGLGYLNLGSATRKGVDFNIWRNSTNNKQFSIDHDAAENAVAMTLYGKARIGETNPVEIDGSAGLVDGLNLPGARGRFRDEIYYHTWFESLDGFYQNTTLSATITLDYNGVLLQTGATLHSIATLYNSAAYGIEDYTWDKKRRIKTRIVIYILTNQEVWFIAGRPGIYAHIGWKIIDNTLYGTVANGINESILNLGTLSGGIQDEVEVIFTPAVEARFYVNGVDQGAITTNLPSGTDYAHVLIRLNIENLTTANRYFIMKEWRFLQEA